MSESDRFKNRAHADGIRPQHLQHADLSWGFVARTEHAGVDSLLQYYPELCGGPQGQCSEAGIVGECHIAEARSALGRGTHERIDPREVQVVVHEHQITARELSSEPTGRIREQHGSHTGIGKQAHAVHDVARWMALVQMAAPLQARDRVTLERANPQLPCVATNAHPRHPRDLPIVERARIAELLDERPQPRPEHHPQLRSGPVFSEKTIERVGCSGHRAAILQVRAADDKLPGGANGLGIDARFRVAMVGAPMVRWAPGSVSALDRPAAPELPQRGYMASKFSQFLVDNKIDPRRIVAASKSIEGLRQEDRIAKAAKRSAKASDKPADASAEKPAKPRSGRPVNAVLLRRLEAGGKVSGPAKQRLVRALNHILAARKKDAVELRSLF